MKWTNKGNEYDRLWNSIKDINAIYLFGAGSTGKTIFEKFHEKIRIKGFIDNNLEKCGKLFCGIPVFSIDKIHLLPGEAIVVSINHNFVDTIINQLKTLEYNVNINLFPFYEFFPVFACYKYNEICISSLSFLPSVKCNLKCKYCLNFSPYIKIQKPRDTQKLKQDLDLLFNKIDTILLLHISGGEPFLYPDLPELLDYIIENYEKKIGLLEVVTNGTVLPSDKLCETLRRDNILLVIDNYCDALPQIEDTYQNVIQKVTDYQIKYIIQKADSWINLDPYNTNNAYFDEAQLCEYFNKCSVPWQEYRDGKLWLCNYASYAEIAGICAAGEAETFDISKDVNKRELLEFRLGYSDKGYTEFCKQCSGYGNNCKIVKVAEQLKQNTGL
jgi:hypothetical protein